MDEAERAVVAALEDECARANTLIGVLRLAAGSKAVADDDYPIYRQYHESRERRFELQEQQRAGDRCD